MSDALARVKERLDARDRNYFADGPEQDDIRALVREVEAARAHIESLRNWSLNAPLYTNDYQRNMQSELVETARAYDAARKGLHDLP